MATEKTMPFVAAEADKLVYRDAKLAAELTEFIRCKFEKKRRLNVKALIRRAKIANKDAAKFEKDLETIDEWVEDVISSLKKVGAYVSGSCVAFCIAKMKNGSAASHVYDVPKDVDIYVKNPINALRKIPKLYCLVGVADLVAASFDDIYQILDGFDCDMVRAAINLADETLHTYHIAKKRLMDDKNPTFELYRANTVQRLVKLQRRAKLWFHGTLDTSKVSCLQDGNMFSSFSNDDDLGKGNLLSHPNSPYRVYAVGVRSATTFFGSRTCVGCHAVIKDGFDAFRHHAYICDDCHETAGRRLKAIFDDRCEGDAKIVVVGGRSGVGRVISERLLAAGVKPRNLTISYHNPLVTPLHPDILYVRYDMTDNPVDRSVVDAMLKADVVVFNAWRTAEENSKHWVHDASGFDEAEFDKKAEVLKSFCRLLSELTLALIEKTKYCDDQAFRKFVIIDADEAKTHPENKIQSGKHYVCNIFKYGQTQMVHTLIEQFAALRVDVLFYDPNWVSSYALDLELKKLGKNELDAPDVPNKDILELKKNYLTQLEKNKRNNEIISIDCLLMHCLHWT